MLNVAIVGGSGYTGLELLRILAGHPLVKVVEITSRQYKEKDVASVFPHLKGFYDGLIFSGPEEFKNLKADLVFCALPHGASQEVVPYLLKAGKKVVDLSADFRIKDFNVYAKWYEAPLTKEAKGLLIKAVYGLPELKIKDKIKKAQLVANPGCYPTGAILALYPLVSWWHVKPDSIVIDSKSGASGAGRQASVETSFVEVAGAFKAYKIGSHRHTPEIEQALTLAALGKKVNVTFTPHLLPVSRGILTTAYAMLTEAKETKDIHALYSKFYKGEFFVRIMDEGKFPDIAEVRGSNFCDIGVYADPKTKRVIIVSAIDNLVKGASGQAVQNMNIMSGFEETTGLKNVPMAY